MELKRLALTECVTETPMPGEIVCEALDYCAVATGLSVGQAYACSQRNPFKDTPNEDALGVFDLTPHATVLAVADGVGGQAGGEQAARLAVQTLAEHLAPLATLAKEELIEVMRPAILNAIEQANQLILELGTGAATTLALVEIVGHMVRPYHVGDSGILVTGQRGLVKLETMAHSPVGYAVGAGLITPDEAMYHEDRHLVQNVLGSNEMRIEIGPSLKLARHDTVLVASDGLFDNMRVSEIIAEIQSGPLPGQGAKLFEEARRRMQTIDDDEHPSKPDDLTAILFRRSK